MKQGLEFFLEFGLLCYCWRPACSACHPTHSVVRRLWRQGCVSCYQALFLRVYDKMYINLLCCFFFLTNKGKNVLIERGTFGVWMLPNSVFCWMEMIGIYQAIGGEVHVFLLVLPTVDSALLFCWCEAETGQGNNFDDEIRGSQADCLLAFREPYKLRATPPLV